MTVLAISLMAGTIITGAFCVPHAISAGALTSFGIEPINSGYAIFSIVILAPWAFVGFEVTSFDTAHFKFPMKKSKKIVVISMTRS